MGKKHHRIMAQKKKTRTALALIPDSKKEEGDLPSAEGRTSEQQREETGGPSGKWQPIATAPVNESVLVFIPHQEHYGIGVYRALRPHFGSLRPWQVTGLHFGRDCHEDESPTHWMPLPEAPSLIPSRDSTSTASVSEAKPKALE